MTYIIAILAKTFHTLTYNGYGISDSCLISHDIPDKANWYLVFKTLTLLVMIFLLISHYMFKTYLICLSNRHSVICISPKPNPNWHDQPLKSMALGFKDSYLIGHDVPDSITGQHKEFVLFVNTLLN